MKKRAPKKKDLPDDMLNSVAKFLEKNGWKVLVIGSPKIQQPIGNFAFNYEFVLSFTGKKKDADS